MGVKSKTAPARVTADMLRRQAVQLRMAGCTLEEIGKQIGRSKGSVSKYINQALAEFARDTEEAIAEVKRMEDARIERLIRAHWPQAIKGHLAATDRVIRLMERKARLHGLDAPQRKELTGKDGGPVAVEGMGLASLLASTDEAEEGGA